VRGTFIADALGLSERAIFEALVGVPQQRRAVIAELGSGRTIDAAVVVVAEHIEHRRDRALLPTDTAAERPWGGASDRRLGLVRRHSAIIPRARPAAMIRVK
jgi:hypothetical protein